MSFRTYPEVSFVLQDLPAGDSPGAFAVDEGAVDRFLNRVVDRLGPQQLDLAEHGFVLQVEPLIALFQGALEHVKRSALVPVKDPDAVRGLPVITFPSCEVLAFELRSSVPLDRAVADALEACRRWTLEDEANLVGNVARLHVIPDRARPGSARSLLTVERLRRAPEEA